MIMIIPTDTPVMDIGDWVYFVLSSGEVDNYISGYDGDINNSYGTLRTGVSQIMDISVINMDI